MPSFVGHNTYFWEVTIATKGESLFLFTGDVRSQWEIGILVFGGEEVSQLVYVTREKRKGKYQGNLLLTHHFNKC